MKNIIWEDLNMDTDEKKVTPDPSIKDTKSWDPGASSGKAEPKADPEPRSSTVRYGGEGHRTSASPQDKKLQEKINASTVTVGGGKLFLYTTSGELYRVGFAVTGMTDEEAEGLSGKYEKLCNDSTIGFLDFDKAIRVNDQWVFSFKLPYSGDNICSVYDMVHGGDGPALSGDKLLGQLVQILINHRSRFTEKDYQPLRCISPHTVFLLRNPRGQVSVRILPLILSGNFPSQVPNDSKPDVTTDVYSACYLTCEVLSGGFAAEGMAIREPSALIQKAMAPFPGWRPSLKAFAEELELDHVGPVSRAKQSSGEEKNESYGIFKGIGQMISDLFPRNEEAIADKRDTTWRDE